MSEMKVQKHWIEGGNLYVRVEGPEREELTSGIRQFVTNYVADPENKLAAWASAGVEKCECPIAFDPKRPEADVMELSKAAAKSGETLKLWYTQAVRLTRGI